MKIETLPKPVMIEEVILTLTVLEAGYLRRILHSVGIYEKNPFATTLSTLIDTLTLTEYDKKYPNWRKL